MTAVLDLPPVVAVGPAGPAPTRHRRTYGRRFGVPPLDDRLMGWLLPLALFGVSFALRVVGLGTPKGMIFDEVYYANDSYSLLKHGVELDSSGAGPGPGYVVHPPLGKWMEALPQVRLHILGIPVGWGHTEVGWRMASVVFGSLSILVFTRTVRRMTGSTVLGMLGGLLLSLDGLEFVQSRIGILDVFVLFWCVVALHCLVADRQRGRVRMDRKVAGGASVAWPGPRVGFRWWRLACGVSLGAMCGVKWSGLFFLAAFAVLAVAWDAGMRRSAGVRAPLRATFWRDLPQAFAAFFLIPLAVYTACWTGWFVSSASTNHGGWDRHYNAAQYPGTEESIEQSVKALWHYHYSAFEFHVNLTNEAHYDKDGGYHEASHHPYESKPVGWLVLARPVAYAYDSIDNGKTLDGVTCTAANDGKPQNCSRAITAQGTPAIWWIGSLAVIGCIFLWAARRDWRAAMVVIVFVIGWGNWLLNSGRVMFYFYALPLLPFIVIALVLMAGTVLGRKDASENRKLVGSLAVGGYTLLVVVNFFWLYPVLSGQVIGYSAWYARTGGWFPGWV